VAVQEIEYTLARMRAEWSHDLPRFVSDLERPSESLVQECPTSETSGYPAFAGPQSFPQDGSKVG
jgi:hypothetical protein